MHPLGQVQGPVRSPQPCDAGTGTRRITREAPCWRQNKDGCTSCGGPSKPPQSAHGMAHRRCHLFSPEGRLARRPIRPPRSEFVIDIGDYRKPTSAGRGTSLPLRGTSGGGGGPIEAQCLPETPRGGDACSIGRSTPHGPAFHKVGRSVGPQFPAKEACVDADPSPVARGPSVAPNMEQSDSKHRRRLGHTSGRRLNPSS